MSARAEPDIGAKPKSVSWRRRRSSASPEQINRQGLITHLAFSLLGGRDPAMLFLNSHHAGLGATPIDLAGETLDGYRAVQIEVRRIAANLSGDET